MEFPDRRNPTFLNLRVKCLEGCLVSMTINPLFGSRKLPPTPILTISSCCIMQFYRKTISGILLLTPNTRLNEAKFRGFDFSEIATRHRIKKQFAKVCSDFFGKFNETNVDFLASVVFQKIVKNHGSQKSCVFWRFLQQFLGKLELLKKKLILQVENLSTELRAIFTVLLSSAYWPSY